MSTQTSTGTNHGAGMPPGLVHIKPLESTIQERLEAERRRLLSEAGIVGAALAAKAIVSV